MARGCLFDITIFLNVDNPCKSLLNASIPALLYLYVLAVSFEEKPTIKLSFTIGLSEKLLRLFSPDFNLASSFIFSNFITLDKFALALFEPSLITKPLLSETGIPDLLNNIPPDINEPALFFCSCLMLTVAFCVCLLRSLLTDALWTASLRACVADADTLPA